MATLERVMQMKGQGLSEDQIVQSLRQEGVSPNEIEESLSQSKIKYALEGEQQTMENNPGMNYDSNMPQSSFQGDDPSAIPLPEESQEQASQEYYPDYQPQSMYQEYQPQQSLDIETINEMVEQAIEEKTDSLKKQVSSFTRFQENSSMDLDKIKERLQKIENTISELQISIIRKIGEYGNDIHVISREMQSTQDTFSKIVDPLTDSIRELREISDNIRPNHHSENNNQQQSNPEPRQTPPQERERKPKDGFENFLR